MPSTVESRAFSLDEWIESGTVAQRTVELFNDRAVPDRLAQLEKRRRIAAQVAEETGEAAVTDVPEVAEIDAEMQRLWEQWQASKETWVVRALSNEEIRALQKAHPVPTQPPALSKKATAATKTAHQAKVDEWTEAALRVRDEADLHYLTWALVRVETAKGTAVAHGTPLDLDGGPSDDFRPAATVETLKTLRARPGRQNDIAKILAAAVDATKADVEVPAPFSQPSSRTDPS